MCSPIFEASMTERFICGATVTSCEETQISTLGRVDLNLGAVSGARSLGNYSTSS